MCLRWAVFYVLAFVQPPIPRCVDLTDPPGRLFGTLFRAQTNTPDQTVERDWRQAMPRAEPALSLALRPLSAVVGAATLRGRQSPRPLRPAARRRKAADTPLKGVLRASAGRVSWGRGAVPGQPPSGLTWVLSRRPKREQSEREGRSAAAPGWACLQTFGSNYDSHR